jgi:hypothetical protein
MSVFAVAVLGLFVGLAATQDLSGLPKCGVSTLIRLLPSPILSGLDSNVVQTSFFQVNKL